MADLTPYILVCGMLIGAISGIVQMLKASFNIPKRFLPIISCVIGVIVGLVTKEFTVYSYYTMGLIGFMGGLSSSGFYDLVKHTKSKND